MPNDRQLFKQFLGQTSQFPMMLEIERAEGLYMYDKEGNEVMDLISGIGVSSVGHRHPAVLSAIQNQLEKHLHVMVYGEFVTSAQVQLAEALTATLPDSIDNAYLVNSGSEAVEGALKLTKRYTGRTEIISFQNAYHGSTAGALSVCGSEDLKNSFRPLVPGGKILAFGQEEELKEISQQTAAVIIEVVQGEAGVQTANTDYFTKLQQQCNEAGCLLIVDEIQSGFGRTGKFWAFEHYCLTPDVVLCAKAMGGGMPMGAFMASREVMQCLTTDPILGHITTFGGHPVSSAASLATLQVIQKENLMADVEKKEALFHRLLIHDHILNIRSKGLMIAVEFESFELLEKIIKNLLDLGVLSDWFLFCDNSMRIAPPLIISEEEIKKACSKILQAIDMSLEG